jgi:hypothetical protein
MSATTLADAPVNVYGLAPRYFRERKPTPGLSLPAGAPVQPPAPVYSIDDFRSFDIATRELRRRVHQAELDARGRIPLRVTLPIVFGISSLMWYGIGVTLGLF